MIATSIVAQRLQPKQPLNSSNTNQYGRNKSCIGRKTKSDKQSANSGDDRQLHLWESQQAEEEVSPYLQIASLPVSERINSKEVRYVLVILPHGVRAAGGQYTAEEAHAIERSTKGWNWSLDANNRPRCLLALEQLLDRICHTSSQCGGEA